VIPLGVNPPLYEKNTESNNPPVILFMSRIEPKKGLNLLIPALERVLAAGHRFQFVLAGSNPQDPAYEAQIQTQIQQSSLAEYTTITGFVTGEEKARLLQTADLFVLPSYYENFGIAVAEAMVAGIPVVISDGVQIWEQVKQAEAGWVSSCEELEIATLIGSALQNQQERQRRGRNAKQFALQQYSWDAIAQQTILAYQQILDGRQVS
jgi:glycosyltransferase involved in cell wall biosynthesis